MREDEALHVVFGYTALNDVTARDLQREHGQWFKGKSLDSTCPIGPWIVTPDELGDPQALAVRLRRNGVEKQHGNTSKMIFSVARLIAELSKGMTLLPGDVIATGTPEGVGFARTPPEFLADGDVLEVEIDAYRHPAQRNSNLLEQRRAASRWSRMKGPRDRCRSTRGCGEGAQSGARARNRRRVSPSQVSAVRVQRGAGDAAAFPDALYEAAGASFADDAASLVADADVVVTVGRPRDDVHRRPASRARSSSDSSIRSATRHICSGWPTRS